MTEQQLETLSGLPDFEHQVRFLLYKLSEDRAQNIGLSCVTQYETPETVPPAERNKVLSELKNEVRARARMGDAAYFDSTMLICKIAEYSEALDRIEQRYRAQGLLDMRVTWMEFRRMVAKEIDAAAQRKRSEWEAAENGDPAGEGRTTGALCKPRT